MAIGELLKMPFGKPVSPEAATGNMLSAYFYLGSRRRVFFRTLGSHQCNTNNYFSPAFSVQPFFFLWRVFLGWAYLPKIVPFSPRRIAESAHSDILLNGCICMKLHGARTHFTPGVGDAFQCERIALRRRKIQILTCSEDIGHGLGTGLSNLYQNGIANKSNTSVDANTFSFFLQAATLWWTGEEKLSHLTNQIYYWWFSRPKVSYWCESCH